MKRFASGAELAKEIGCNPKVLAQTFAKYNQAGPHSPSRLAQLKFSVGGTCPSYLPEIESLFT